MQFKYSGLLWGLFLLLIPIFIHFFQLRKFKKTSFTNVKILQEVIVKSRKSNTIEKWMLLIVRMGLFSALIIAFAQPFFAKKTALKEKELVFYLDNSFSMQAKTNNGTLLNTAVQKLLKAIPKNQSFSLFTNDRTYKNIVLKDIQNDLLALAYSPKQLQLNKVYLKARALFGEEEYTVKNLVLISDFQKRFAPKTLDSSDTMQTHYVQLLPDYTENISIDSVYISSVSPDNKEITAIISGNKNIKNVPVSLFNDKKLIAKTSANFKTNKKTRVVFSIQNNTVINGEIRILDTALTYDNQLFFNINKKEKTSVLVIDEATSNYLKRIFSEDEFKISSYLLKNLNYNILDKQHLIILNELNTIPLSLSTALLSFTKNGGSLVVIPSSKINLESYNILLKNYFSSTFTEHIEQRRKITSISFSHPLYQNVFDKKVTNFQYPLVSNYYKLTTTAPKVLSYDNDEPFLVGANNTYIYTASITETNSNFKNSPLIVPVFYNMGVHSLKLPKLYSVLGDKTTIDIPIKLVKEHILKIKNKGYEFIPDQRLFDTKVTLTFTDNPKEQGIYSIEEKNIPLKNISFNHTRKESVLEYLDLNRLNATTKQNSIISLFKTLEKDNSVTEIWKWFIIFALFFILGEVLIQKYFK